MIPWVAFYYFPPRPHNLQVACKHSADKSLQVHSPKKLKEQSKATNEKAQPDQAAEYPEIPKQYRQERRRRIYYT